MLDDPGLMRREARAVSHMRGRGGGVSGERNEEPQPPGCDGGGGSDEWQPRDLRLDDLTAGNTVRSHGDFWEDMLKDMEDWDNVWNGGAAGQGHVLGNTALTGRRGFAPELITGMRGEERVVICPRCQRDIPERSMSEHRCGQWRCREGCGHSEGIGTPEAGSAQPAHADSHGGRWHDGIWNDEEHCAEHGTSAGDGRWSCIRCNLPTSVAGVQWRICRCSAMACTSCAPEPCPACGAEAIWREKAVVERHAFEAGVREGGAHFRGLPYDGEFLHVPLVITPPQARQRRDAMKAAASECRAKARAESGRTAREQVRSGTRPPRLKAEGSLVRVVTANVTAASSWEDELANGDALTSATFQAVQEHRLADEGKDRAAGRMMQAGWDCIIDTACMKDCDYGGGTALLADRNTGVRPWKGGERCNSMLEGVLRGRAPCGVIDLVGGALLISFWTTLSQPAPMLAGAGYVSEDRRATLHFHR